MPQRSRSLRRIILVLGDVAVFASSLALAVYLRAAGSPDPEIVRLYIWISPILYVLWLAGFIMFGLYDLKLAKNEPLFFERLTRAVVLNLVVTILLFYSVPALRLRPLATLLVLFPVLALLIFAWRALANAILTRKIRERVLFLGMTSEVTELAEFIDRNSQLGYKSVAFVQLEGGYSETELLAGKHIYPADAHLASVIQERNITIIVAAHNLKRTRTLVKALFDIVPLGVTITDFPRFYEAVRGKVPVSLISETWFLENLVGTRRPRYEFGKRALDIALAVLLGAVTTLLLPFIALAIVLSTPRAVLAWRETRAREGDGIIFFRQSRVGKNGKLFWFVKFRSQILGAERMGHEKNLGGETHPGVSPSDASLPPLPMSHETGNKFPFHDKNKQKDPRAYPVGSFLRKTYLDEFPQLWNVLQGEMSFIGPRPERPRFVEELENKIPFYRMRELVLPGITGWSQINMENDQSVSDAPEKMQYDLYYIKNRSLALDITILLKTVFKILQRSGR